MTKTKVLRSASDTDLNGRRLSIVISSPKNALKTQVGKKTEKTPQEISSFTPSTVVQALKAIADSRKAVAGYNDMIKKAHIAIKKADTTKKDIQQKIDIALQLVQELQKSLCKLQEKTSEAQKLINEGNKISAGALLTIKESQELIIKAQRTPESMKEAQEITMKAERVIKEKELSIFGAQDMIRIGHRSLDETQELIKKKQKDIENAFKVLFNARELMEKAQESIDNGLVTVEIGITRIQKQNSENELHLHYIEGYVAKWKPLIQQLDPLNLSSSIRDLQIVREEETDSILSSTPSFTSKKIARPAAPSSLAILETPAATSLVEFDLNEKMKPFLSKLRSLNTELPKEPSPQVIASEPLSLSSALDPSPEILPIESNALGDIVTE